MASASLSPSVSRPHSLRTKSPPDLVSPDDGYDYNKIEIDPARKATKPRNLPSPVAVSEIPQDFNSTTIYEDQDNTYTETLPHIYQRQRGGWNAKVPDLETSKSNDQSRTTASPSNARYPCELAHGLGMMSKNGFIRR